MRISSVAFSFLAMVSLASCSQRFGESKKPGMPNLDSLRTKANFAPSTIRKISELNGMRDSIVLSGSGTEESLAVLEKLSLFNKPVFADQYKNSILDDSQSNLKVQRWQAKTVEAPIQQLEIYFNEESKAWYLLKAVFKADNLLFKKEEQISIGLDPLSARFEEISVKGKQKMVFFDEEQYFIKLKLIYP